MQTNLLSNGHIDLGERDETSIIDSTVEREFISIHDSNITQVDLPVSFDRISWKIPNERVTWAAIECSGNGSDLSIQALKVCK